MNELATNIEEVNQDEQQRIIEELAALSVVVIDLLNKYAKKESVITVQDTGTKKTIKRTTVPTSKLSGILADLNRLEQRINNVLYGGTIEAMKKAAEETVDYLKDELDISKADIIDVDKTLGKQVTIGDKTLEQRTKMLSSEMTDDIRKAIRQGVLGGQDVNDIVSDVRKTFKDTDWKVRRIVESEVYTAYRYQFGETTSQNGYDWIRIYESFPRHPRRKKHRCYALANADKYGKGNGVYKSTDTEIFYPHPQCTSWLEVVEALD